MRTKRLAHVSRGITFVLLAVLTLSLLLPVVVAKPTFSKDVSQLKDPGNYAFGASGVRGKIKFVDDGSTLTIEGKARGLTPGVPYASLIYDIASPHEGPIACEPFFFPPHPDSIFLTMFVGFWDVDERGRGTLTATNIGTIFGPGPPFTYVPLSKIGSISIRDLTAPNPGPPGLPGTGPAAVVACGDVVGHP